MKWRNKTIRYGRLGKIFFPRTVDSYMCELCQELLKWHFTANVYSAPRRVLTVILPHCARCGRAQRPDAALKVVFALRKDGIVSSSTLSNAYFKAKKVCINLLECFHVNTADVSVLHAHSSLWNVAPILTVCVFPLLILILQQESEGMEDDSQADRREPFRVMQLFNRQMEHALEIECGLTDYSPPMNFPIERIRIRFWGFL